MSPRTESTNILVMIDEELKRMLDKACADAGLSRAHFIRIAVGEKLERQGIHVSKELIHPPPRTGKGGRPPNKQKMGKSADIHHGATAQWPDHPKTKAPDAKAADAGSESKRKAHRKAG